MISGFTGDGVVVPLLEMTPGKPFETLQYSWVRKGNWKFLQRHSGIDSTKFLAVHDWDRVPVQLFDLSSDPGETVNLAEQRPELVKRFQDELSREYPRPDFQP